MLLRLTTVETVGLMPSVGDTTGCVSEKALLLRTAQGHVRTLHPQL